MPLTRSTCMDAGMYDLNWVWSIVVSASIKAFDNMSIAYTTWVFQWYYVYENMPNKFSGLWFLSLKSDWGWFSMQFVEWQMYQNAISSHYITPVTCLMLSVTFLLMAYWPNSYTCMQAGIVNTYFLGHVSISCISSSYYNELSLACSLPCVHFPNKWLGPHLFLSIHLYYLTPPASSSIVCPKWQFRFPCILAWRYRHICEHLFL